MPTSSETPEEVETVDRTNVTKKHWGGTCPGTSRDQKMMGPGDMLCHGPSDCMTSASTKMYLGFILKFSDELKNTAWHLKTAGVLSTLQYARFKVLKAMGAKGKAKSMKAKKKKEPVCDEVLNLQAGELVEVKSEEEIWATLDTRRRYKGMYFMRGMREFCGKRLRVYKRVERIFLESNREYRRIKDTVILTGALCDGGERSGCDRSCFYYWKETWLRRVEERDEHE